MNCATFSFIGEVPCFELQAGGSVRMQHIYTLATCFPFKIIVHVLTGTHSCQKDVVKAMDMLTGLNMLEQSKHF